MTLIWKHGTGPRTVSGTVSGPIATLAIDLRNEDTLVTTTIVDDIVGNSDPDATDTDFSYDYTIAGDQVTGHYTLIVRDALNESPETYEITDIVINGIPTGLSVENDTPTSFLVTLNYTYQIPQNIYYKKTVDSIWIFGNTISALNEVTTTITGLEDSTSYDIAATSGESGNIVESSRCATVVKSTASVVDFGSPVVLSDGSGIVGDFSIPTDGGQTNTPTIAGYSLGGTSARPIRLRTDNSGASYTIVVHPCILRNQTVTLSYDADIASPGIAAVDLTPMGDQTDISVINRSIITQIPLTFFKKKSSFFIG